MGAARGRPRACPLVRGAPWGGEPRGRFCACPLARGVLWRALKASPCVPARTRRTPGRSEGSPVRARSHAGHSGVSRAAQLGAPRGRPRACPLARGALWRALRASPCVPARGAHGRAPGALLCVPARTRRSLACPEGASVRARSQAALLGAARGRSCAYPLARGALWRAPRALLCVPARTRRKLACHTLRTLGRPEGASCVPARTRRAMACPESASVRSGAHAALMGAARGRPRACPLARGALWRAPRVLQCVPARTRRSLARPESDSVRARWHAAHLGAPRRRFRVCPLARGAS